MAVLTVETVSPDYKNSFAIAGLAFDIVMWFTSKFGDAAAAHHIVAGSSPKAAEARAILQKYGVDIKDAANGTRRYIL